MRTRTLVAAAAAAGLALAGCTPAAEPSASPSATPSASPAASASPTPSTTPSPTASATSTAAATGELDCPSWDDGYHPDGPASVNFNRYAGICVGMSFEEASGTYAGPPLTGEAACPWVTLIVSEGAGSLYVSAISEWDAPGDRILFFHALWYDDPAAAPAAEMPATAEGVTIGSTEAEVYAAYPAAFENTFEDISRGARTQIVVPGPSGYGYVFDIMDGYVWEITWGEGLDGGVSGEFCAA